MNRDLIGLAFTAGLVAALNPCGFAMLPAYLALVVRGNRSSDGRQHTLIALGRAVAATAAMTLGFVAVFATFALLTVAAASSVQRYLPYITVTIGIVLAAIGIWLSLGRDLGRLTRLPHAGRAPTARVGSMFGYGLSYAIASLSCTIGPFLAASGAAFRSGSVTAGLFVFAAYATGFTLVVGALAIAAAMTTAAVADRVRRIVPYANRISGVLLVVVGLYVGYYGVYEIRLFRGDGDPDDPVIAAAGRLQGAIAGWVHRNGAWPWVGVLAALLMVALLMAWRARATRAAKCRHADRATAGGAP